MTKKDYIKAAKIVNDLRKSIPAPTDYELDFVVCAFSDLFENDNPKFDNNRFRKACGITDGN